MIGVPEPVLAPVILPVIVPIVHVKELAALAVNAIFGPMPLHVFAVAAVVTAGLGFTVTVMVKGDPTHVVPIEAGVTIYCTVPAAEVLGLVSV